jgi:hypothetical protein
MKYVHVQGHVCDLSLFMSLFVFMSMSMREFCCSCSKEQVPMPIYLVVNKYSTLKASFCQKIKGITSEVTNIF